MKIALLSITVFFMSSNFAVAASGKFVCADDSAINSVWGASEVAAALNKLNCDTAKPVTVSKGDRYTLVCCVQK